MLPEFVPEIPKAVPVPPVQPVLLICDIPVACGEAMVPEMKMAGGKLCTVTVQPPDLSVVPVLRLSAVVPLKAFPPLPLEGGDPRHLGDGTAYRNLRRVVRGIGNPVADHAPGNSGILIVQGNEGIEGLHFHLQRNLFVPKPDPGKGILRLKFGSLKPRKPGAVPHLIPVASGIGRGKSGFQHPGLWLPPLLLHVHGKESVGNPVPLSRPVKPFEIHKLPPGPHRIGSRADASHRKGHL